MALSIKDEETDRLVRKLARQAGLSYTAAIRVAVQNELTKRRAPTRNPGRIREAVRALQEEIRNLPLIDPRTPDEILGYDEYGLPR
jgi:antitoxin VapB